MNTAFLTRTLGPIAAFTAALLAGCTQEPPAPAQFLDSQEVTATVTALDPETRMITLSSPQDGELTFLVGEGVRNLDQVQVGDRVTLGFYSGLAAEVAEADSEGTVAVGADARAAPGERPAGVESISVSGIVTIEGVDTRRNTVSFRGEDGLMRAVDVNRPEMQEFIRGLRQGDRVRLTYTEAVAVRVQPAS
jgi:hypothetical protein